MSAPSTPPKMAWAATSWREDARIREQRRPGAAAAIGVEAVDHGHRRPERGALELRRDDPALPAAQAEPPEGDAGGGAVREVDRGAGEPPVATRQRRSEQPDVGVRGPEEAPQARLRRGPRGRRGHAGERRRGDRSRGLNPCRHVYPSSSDGERPSPHVPSCSSRATCASTTTPRWPRPSSGPSVSCRSSCSTTPSSRQSARRTALAFLLDALRDLDAGLRRAAAGLVVRSGDVVGETVRLALDVGAEAVYMSEDVSAYAQERERRLRRTLAGSRIGARALLGRDRRAARRPRACRRRPLPGLHPLLAALARAAAARRAGGARADRAPGRRRRRACWPALDGLRRGTPATELPERRRDRGAAAPRCLARRRARPLR